MKKLVFATMLLCTVSISAFAKSDNLETKIKVNERDAPDCRSRGGNCLVVITLNGVNRTYRICCNDVIVIGVPPGGSN